MPFSNCPQVVLVKNKIINKSQGIYVKFQKMEQLKLEAKWSLHIARANCNGHNFLSFATTYTNTTNSIMLVNY